MGQLVEVLAVEVPEVDADGPLLGANLDDPSPGRRIAAGAVEIGGWALGRTPVAAVEAVLAGEAVAMAPVRRAREDIAAAFPQVAAAGHAGFQISLDLRGASAELDLEVRARVGEDSIPIGGLRLRKLWRDDLGDGEPPLVSVIVLAGDEDEATTARTLASVGSQRHEPTEVLFFRGRSPAAIRNEAIRRSSGRLLCFLPAGASLVEGALAAGVEALRERPAAAARIDGSPQGVAAALYRRSAFEELDGFDSGAGDCDTEAAIRAAGLGARFEPGSIVAGGE
ncbi:MAG TPA: hypothetical protein VFN92_03650 [Solirubrobacterales bacterium]|nr:hypothetical protein [Solirubrobacterales bacterium]